MAGLRAVIIVVILMALMISVTGEKQKRSQARRASGNPDDCLHQMEHHYPGPCKTTPVSSTESTTTTTTATIQNDGENTDETGTLTGNTGSGSSLTRAHWCRFGNGTYLPLGYTYIQSTCSMCQCTTSRAIRCKPLQCMPTYCIDNTMPFRKSGQCCTQCGYEITTNSCLYNGISFPHGAIMKSVENKLQCWCQLGNIECRNYIGSLFQSLDLLADGTAIYIVVVVLCVVLIFGLLICCGCTVFFYYHYQRNQQAIQQAYDQYFNSAGWQPMTDEDQQVIDVSAEEKGFEAEKSQFDNATNGSVPPPYAVYSNPYVAEEDQKHM